MLNLDGHRRSAYELLSHPGQDFSSLSPIWPWLSDVSTRVRAAMEIEAIYAVYMERQESDIQQVKRDEAVAIPVDFDYQSMPGLSNELKIKLSASRPADLAQAAKVDGMTPAALTLILALVRRSASAA